MSAFAALLFFIVFVGLLYVLSQHDDGKRGNIQTGEKESAQSRFEEGWALCRLLCSEARVIERYLEEWRVGVTSNSDTNCQAFNKDSYRLSYVEKTYRRWNHLDVEVKESGIFVQSDFLPLHPQDTPGRPSYQITFPAGKGREVGIYLMFLLRKHVQSR